MSKKIMHFDWKDDNKCPLLRDHPTQRTRDLREITCKRCADLLFKVVESWTVYPDGDRHRNSPPCHKWGD